MSAIGAVSWWIIDLIFSFTRYLWPYFSIFFVDSWGKPFQLILLAFLISIVYYSSVTYDKTVDMTELGYDYLLPEAKKRGKKLSVLVEETNRSRDLGELPPIYPNGWIPLMESKDLAIKQSTPINALGRHFVVFRGKTGKSFILDAFCPHLGANLGICGRVYDDCVQCPFHHWTFSGHDGSCIKIPYANKVPEFAKIKTWLSIERNGFIYVWHHAEGQHPSWEPPVIPEIEEGLWNYKGRIQHTISCHIQDLAENAADVAHFTCVHKSSIFFGRNFHSDAWFNFLKHIWSVVWSAHPSPNQHVATSKLKIYTSLFGITLPRINLEIEAKQVGPAIVYIYVDGLFTKGIYVHCVTPQGPYRQKLIQQFYSPYPFTKLLGRIFLMGNKYMVERDIRMLNNKKHWKNPLLVSEDRLIARYRKWYSQFFSPNSPRLDTSIPSNW